MDFEKEVFSKVLAENDYHDSLAEVMAVLKRNQISEVEILFGFAFGSNFVRHVVTQ